MEVPDHRQLGRRLGIFATEEQCGAGLPFWLSAGAVVRDELEAFVKDLERRHGYVHVNTPAMAKRELYERSGHWAHYQEDMYPEMQIGAEHHVLRPMLCPHHILIFDQHPHSWRDLPLRIGEVGPMFRYERSGVVGGLSRVRQSTLNDGHIFCPEGSVSDEIVDVLSMIDETYRALHIPAPKLRLSRGGAGPKYVSDPSVWRRSEAMIRDALARVGAAYKEAENEAAFYGPKIDLQVSDPRGREETLSTVQVDLVLPTRFDLHFERDGARQRPIIIHRSIIGTLERMTAHLLEVHNGALPTWLAPTQVLVLPAEDEAHRYAAEVNKRLGGAGLRAEIDARDATLGSRIRAAHARKVPYLAIVGQREQQDQSVSVRLRTGQQLPPLRIDEFVEMVQTVTRSRDADLTR